MTPATSPQVQSAQSHLDRTTRLGGWLFRHRTAIPLPLAAAVLLLRAGRAGPSRALVVTGITVTVLGECLRFWAVHHIGVISRTRSDRVGPLVYSGPFGAVRNPLYIGNIALWTGFAVAARLLWLASAIVVMLAFEYHAIVRWEEQLLEQRLGDAYREYAARVPRWVPVLHRRDGGPAVPFSWRDTFYSERGTLIAIAAGYVLLWLKP